MSYPVVSRHQSACALSRTMAASSWACSRACWTKVRTSLTSLYTRDCYLHVDTVNRELKQHARKVYSRQMIEHIVTQIDTLYWDSGAPEEPDTTEADTSTVDNASTLFQTDDLTLDANITKLPTTWPGNDASISQDTYLSSVSRLQELSARRQALQNKLSTYRTLLTLLEPYRRPKEDVQPNLVWKDTPLAPELMKMRTLAIRVAGRVSERFGDVQVPATAEEDGEGDVDMKGLDEREKNRRKVARVLDDW